MVINALQAVLMVVALVAVGFFVGWRGWAGSSVTSFITKLIINITLPCTVISTFTSGLTAAELGSSWIYFLAAFAAMGLAYLLSKIVVKAAKIKKTQRGVFSVLFALSNAGYMGLPVAFAIFGEQGMLFALFYFVANAVFMNSIGYLDISADGMAIRGESGKTEARGLAKRILSPSVLAVPVAFALVMLNVQLPRFLDLAIGYAGDITSPLALIFVGIVLQRTGLGCIRRFDKNMVLALIGRFIASPLIMLAVAYAFGIDAYATNVLVIQTSLPAMVATTIFAEGTGADTELAARGVVITTLLSFVSIPVYIAILG